MPEKSFEETHADEIAWRVRAGLSREHAVRVVRAQVAHDEAEAEKAKADAKKSKKSE
jgi:hypothetical protein